MFKQKFNTLKVANKELRAARDEFKRLERNFGCYDSWKMVCAGNPCDNNGTEIPWCNKYELTVHCPCVECRNYDWNTRHYNAYINLCNAKMARLKAFVNLFRRNK